MLLAVVIFDLFSNPFSILARLRCKCLQIAMSIEVYYVVPILTVDTTNSKVLTQMQQQSNVLCHIVL